jgi:hypothetical protein
MFDWEKAKVVEMKKPDLWSGTLKEQEDLYNVVLAYYCWLHIREDLNARLLHYTHKVCMRTRIGVHVYQQFLWTKV